MAAIHGAARTIDIAAGTGWIALEGHAAALEFLVGRGHGRLLAKVRLKA